MIKAIALDDEPLPLRLLKTFAAQTEFVDLVATFTSPSEARAYLEANDVDLLFLDIHMPDVSGIDFSRNLPRQLMVIFTTAFSEFAVEGFNLKAVDYLLKPFEYDRFLQGVERAKEIFDAKSSQKDNHLFIRADHGMTKISFNDILYVEGLNNYIKIVLVNRKPILVRMSMKEMNDKLATNGFMRVHRSYIVPLKNVVAVRNRTVYLGDTEIPVGINYAKEVKNVFYGKL